MPPEKQASHLNRARAQEIGGTLGNFLYLLGRFEAEMLLPGIQPIAFVTAESSAVTTVNYNGFVILQMDRDRARAGRAPFGPSWAFERLHWLSTSSTVVEVWEWDLVSLGEQGIAGSTQRDPASIHDGRVGRFYVNVDTLDPQRRAPSLDQVGETVVHELVLHVYREARYGVGRRHQPYVEGSPNHASYPFHSPVQANEGAAHAPADLEADLLAMILRGRAQRIRTGRLNDEQEAWQQQHDALVRRSIADLRAMASDSRQLARARAARNGWLNALAPLVPNARYRQQGRVP
jgi:hypothetical protein